MPLAFDAAASTFGDGVSSLSWSHTCSGSERLLTVGVSMTAGPMPTVDSVTYNGVALTRIGTATNGGGWAKVELWRLIAPATGAHTVAVTLSGAGDLAAGAISFTGAHQTTPAGTFASAQGTSATPSVNVSGAAGDIVIDCLMVDQGTAPTVDASQVQRWTHNWAANGSGSTEAGAATVTMSWSSTNADWLIGGVAVKPAAAVAPPPFANRYRPQRYRRRRLAA